MKGGKQNCRVDFMLVINGTFVICKQGHARDTFVYGQLKDHSQGDVKHHLIGGDFDNLQSFIVCNK